LSVSHVDSISRLRRTAGRALACAGLLLALATGGCSTPSGTNTPYSAAKPTVVSTEARALTERAEQVLWAILKDTQAGWGRIHAAEVLAPFGHKGPVRQYILSTIRAWESSAQRIGAYRVLAATSREASERERWVHRVQAVVREPAAPDRLQAIEALGKLGAVSSGEMVSVLRATIPQWTERERPFVDWALHLAGDADGTNRLFAAIGATDPEMRRRAAYITRRLTPVPRALRERLSAEMRIEKSNTVAYPYELAACLMLGEHPISEASAGMELRRIWESGSGAVKQEISLALAPLVNVQELPAWSSTLDSTDVSTRVAGATLILKVLASTGR
jgi:hypothetical protein